MYPLGAHGLNIAATSCTTIYYIYYSYAVPIKEFSPSLSEHVLEHSRQVPLCSRIPLLFFHFANFVETGPNPT